MLTDAKPKLNLVFASGSCRLMTTINNGRNKIRPLHSMFYNFEGINFLGKLHNTKQHIQFIRFIQGDLEIPLDILQGFLTSCHKGSQHLCSGEISTKIKNIKDEFDECSVYIFEICSLKLYEKNGFQVQFELTNDHTETLQTKDELRNDLIQLINMIPKNKRIVFQCHFRMNIMWNDQKCMIQNREDIFDVLQQVASEFNNVRVYDPSEYLKNNKSSLSDATHFNEQGHVQSFDYIFDHFISKSF